MMLSAFQARFLVAAVFITLFLVYHLHHGTSISQRWRSASALSPSGAQITLGEAEARYLSPAELMNRPLAGSQKSIPRIIHQSWSSRDLPAKFEKWSQTCRRAHPEWEWVLWTDDDNRRLVERFVPGMLKAYEDLRGPIFRADIVRNAYLYLFGGMYADLDVECLRPADELFSNFSISTYSAHDFALNSRATRDSTPSTASVAQKVFVGRMGTDEGFEHSIPNAWMASPPGHPFYKLMMEWATQKITSNAKLDSRPEAVTGPIALRDGIERFKKGITGLEVLLLPEVLSAEAKEAFPMDAAWKLAKVEVLPFQYIYPYSWHRDGDMFRKYCWSTLSTFDAERCKELVAVNRWPSWTITYWSHTWNGDGPNEGNLEKVE